MGFSRADAVLIATVISELARNIVLYASKGEIILEWAREGSRSGIMVIAKDEGPGIPDIALAMQPGYSTSRGLGLGLPGVRRIMDEMNIQSVNDHWSSIVAKKWLISR